jgi:hypothetical protein
MVTGSREAFKGHLMKSLVISFAIALITSCLLFSFASTLPGAPPIPPYPIPVAVNGVSSTALGVRREDGQMPEMLYTDKTRTFKYMTRIDEKSQEPLIDFPAGGVN